MERKKIWFNLGLSFFGLLVAVLKFLGDLSLVSRRDGPVGVFAGLLLCATFA